jgi:AcrR family transcriptional regulator
MNPMTPKTGSRPYRKIERARREAETRLRITEAAVELHRSVGPANTTVTEVAQLAGVTRMTVYNHFPTDTDLFVACSTHWASQNPFPDPTSWTEIADPPERLLRALTEFYAWYGDKEDMLGKVFRDTPLVPSLGEVMEGFWTGYVDELVGVLSQGWRMGVAERPGFRAALRLALDFNTWRGLTSSGLGQEDAAALISRMVNEAFQA